MLSATAIAIGCHVAAWGVAALMLLVFFTYNGRRPRRRDTDEDDLDG